MSLPYRCPICCGEGTIAKSYPYGMSAGGPPPLPDRCHACDGKGIVWESEQDYQPVPPNRTFTVKTRYVFTGKGEPGRST